jgi:LuxR family transcriptional regulator, quorum-sensing system regulator CciR
MEERIFHDIERTASPADLFELLVDYFDAKGFAGVCYVAPESATAPYVLMDRGMPAEWMARYKTHALHLHDPIPGMALRLAHPERLGDVVDMLPTLSADEQAFIEAFRETGMTNGLAIPTFGPYGRPGFIGLTQPRHADTVRELDLPLATAVAQQVHHKMALLQASEPLPPLSPREREILRWIG